MPAHIAPLTIKISLADSDSLDKGKAIYCKQIYWLVDGVRKVQISSEYNIDKK